MTRKTKIVDYTTGTGFGIDDVISAAESLAMKITRDHAEIFLRLHERNIDEAACIAGNDRISDLLRALSLTTL